MRRLLPLLLGILSTVAENAVAVAGAALALPLLTAVGPFLPGPVAVVVVVVSAMLFGAIAIDLYRRLIAGMGRLRRVVAAPSPEVRPPAAPRPVAPAPAVAAPLAPAPPEAAIALPAPLRAAAEEIVNHRFAAPAWEIVTPERMRAAEPAPAPDDGFAPTVGDGPAGLRIGIACAETPLRAGGDARIALRFRADAAIPATGMRLRLDAPAAGEIARLDYPIAAGVPAGERTIIVAMGIPGTASGRALVSVEFDGVSGRYVAPVSIA